mgnify:CR=1 FL=1
MTSILTNVGAISALQTLRSINSDMATAQGRVSSGLRVQYAADNAAYWSIATTMRSENMVLSAVSDSIGLAQAIADTAYAALDTVVEHLDAMKSLFVSARSMEPIDITDFSYYSSTYFPDAGAEKRVDPKYAGSLLHKLDVDMLQHIMAINSAVDSASFNGVNLLAKPKDGVDLDDAIAAKFVVGYAQGDVQKLNVASRDLVLFNANYASYGTVAETEENTGILDGDINIKAQMPDGSWWWTSAPIDIFNSTIFDESHDNVGISVIYDLESVIQLSGFTRDSAYDHFLNEFDQKIQSVVSAQAKLGSVQHRLEMAGDFNFTLMDAYTSGIGRLVDADMSEESTRLKALETQQQLGIQALQIANSNSENVLALFR